jgi:hypothetical protein
MALRSYLHTTFDPRRIPGLQAWYDAADSASITLDSGRVSQWSDKSGNARHATNTTSGSTQPSYSTAARNGLNVLRFAAASVQRLTVAGTGTFNFLHNGTESYFVAVSRYASVSNPDAVYTLFGNNGGASANTGTFYAFDDRSSASRNNASSIFITRSVVGQSASSSLIQDVIAANTFTVQEHLIAVANATASQRSRVSINGGAYQGNNTLAYTPSSGNATFALQIGASGDSTAPMEGDICELMFFNQQPTAAARDLIRRHLGSKWGVTLA